MKEDQSRRSINLQPRDYDLLRGLLESRVMTTQQIELMYFQDALPYAYKRLAALLDAGILDIRTRESAANRRIFFLTKRGFDALMAKRQDLPVVISWLEMDRRLRKLTDKYLAHELSVMDAKIALTRATAAAGRQSWCTTWPRLHRFTVAGSDGRKHAMRPDAFLRVTWQEDDSVLARDFFIEIDRSHEVLPKLIEKAWRYRNYLNSGGYQREFCHTGRDAPVNVQEYHFTVLVVVPSAARRNNIAMRLLAMHPPVRQLVWLTTIDELLADPLAAIWLRPTDVLAAVRGTSYDPDQREPGTTGLSDAACDAMIDQRARRWSLLDEPRA